MPCNPSEHLPLDRRTFLVASGVGYCGLHVPGLLDAAISTAPPGRKVAKSTILIWLDGGPSHIDTWDMKPNAPREYRGEFQTIPTSAAGITLCEHLPLLARQTHHLAIVHSLGHDLLRGGANNHASGYYYNLTGHPPDPSFGQLGESRGARPDDWPFMGSVVAYKRELHPSLPQLVTLPRKVRVITETAGQFSARLGTESDPLYVYGSREHPTNFTVPALKLQGNVTPQRLQHRQQLLNAIDNSQRALDRSLITSDYDKHQQRAFSLLYSRKTKKAFDISQEPESVRSQYGKGVNAMSMLMARRLVEAGVPFVTVIWKKEDPELHKKKFCNGAGSWDTHGKNFVCLKEILLPNFDRMFAALLDDLHQRGLLSETLVMVTGEMGRQPKIGDTRPGGSSGRNHWRQCMSVLFAGGGIRGGQTYGSSGKLAEYPADKPVAPEDIAKTVYHAMGIDNLDAVDRNGRPFNLLEEGRPITGLF